MRRISLALLVALLLPALASGASREVKLSLVAYSTPREAYKKLIPAFQATPAGQGITFSQSYGGSGDQSRAVLAGLPADVVEFSNEPDMTALVKPGLVSRNWKNNKYHGMITASVVVFCVRNGNPKHIKTWNDLIKPGVQIISANPFQSGGGQWNVAAAYGSQIKVGKTPARAAKYLLSYFKHVVVQDKSARDALNTFLSGKGDVLVTYENEAILAEKTGQHVQYTIPRTTIQIENPLAVTNGKNQAAAKAFYRFLYTPAAQNLFAQTGYRPVVASVAKQFKFFKPRGLFRIGLLGGWTKAETFFFDRNSGLMTKIERQVGGSSG